MKKLYLLTALLSVTTGSIFAMDMDNDEQLSQSSDLSEISTASNQSMMDVEPAHNEAPVYVDSDDEDDDYAALTHFDFHTRIDNATTRAKWATATGLLFAWTRHFNRNPRTAEAYAYIPALTLQADRIDANARFNGYGQKDRTITLREIIARIVAAHTIVPAQPNN